MNTPLTLIHTAICRTPALSPGDQLTDAWPQLKTMIRDASPEFHEVIAGLDFADLNKAGDKVKHAIWKYFNRARFRATPFGQFAAVSLIPLTADLQEPLTLQRDPVIRQFRDWSEIDAITSNAQTFLANSTWCEIAGEIRYICKGDDQFELTAIKMFPELKGLLDFCNKPVAAPEIYQYMRSAFELLPNSVETLLRQLADAQVLLTDICPNIIGDDYFKRMTFQNPSSQKNYIIAERKVLAGSLDTSVLRDLPAYLNFLHNFLPPPPEGNLAAFATALTRKFDRRAIPLAIALDPETGVGYGSMAQIPDDPEQADLRHFLQKPQKSDPVIAYTPLHQFLINQLIKGDTIRLEAYHGPIVKTNLLIPNTLSVIFHQWNGQPVIESAGGVTANSLLGRFTLGDPEWTNEGKKIAALEQEANPAVLFFDISYQAEKKVDNINRRAALYPTELPLLTWPSSSDPLSLADILVAVRDGEILLWSVKHHKRLIPRIATAYNYTRSDLALYRFLCDLQHQQLRSDICFRIRQFFPGLDHYPRIAFKSLVVSPEMWRVQPHETNTIPALRKWLRDRYIDHPFKCGEGDQVLYFDPARLEDLEAFCLYVRQNSGKELYLSESRQSDTDIVKNEQGSGYTPQFIVNYCHARPVYSSIAFPSPVPAAAHYPGGKWLYAELYCHPTRSGQVLAKYILPYLKRHANTIGKWFFVRYANPAPHIRLRIKPKDIADAHILVTDLNNRLEPLLTAGLIADVQLKTYFPETERYGAGRMDRVEIFFHADSAYVINRLPVAKTNSSQYLETLVLIDCWCRLGLPDIEERLMFIQAIAEGFSTEFNYNNEAYKSINKNFEKLKSGLKETTLPRAYQKVLGSLINECTPGPEKAGLLADLIHMHVNRTFSSEQRFHESLLYQYLLKWTKGKRFSGAATPAHLEKQ